MIAKRYTEASVHERGFSGIHDGLRFVELHRFWMDGRGRKFMLIGFLSEDEKAPVPCSRHTMDYRECGDRRKILVGRDGFLTAGERWFDDVDDFSEGAAVAERDGVRFYIGYDGKPLANLAFSVSRWEVYGRRNGHARVRNMYHNKWMFISNDWKLPEFGMAFDKALDFEADGFAMVTVGDDVCFIDSSGAFSDEDDNALDDKENERIAGACRRKADGMRDSVGSVMNGADVKKLRY